MPEYLSPGVYIEEVNYGPGAIQGVGTSMPVFIGFTEKAESARMIGGERVLSLIHISEPTRPY